MIWIGLLLYLIDEQLYSITCFLLLLLLFAVSVFFFLGKGGLGWGENSSVEVKPFG